MASRRAARITVRSEWASSGETTIEAFRLLIVIAKDKYVIVYNDSSISKENFRNCWIISDPFGRGSAGGVQSYN